MLVCGRACNYQVYRYAYTWGGDIYIKEEGDKAWWAVSSGSSIPGMFPLQSTSELVGGGSDGRDETLD